MKKTSHIPCIVCGKAPTDRCHIKTVGSGGSNDDSNILIMCRDHHQEQHRLGFVRFIENHKHIMKILTEKNWEIRDVLGVRKLVKK